MVLLLQSLCLRYWPIRVARPKAAKIFPRIHFALVVIQSIHSFQLLKEVQVVSLVLRAEMCNQQSIAKYCDMEIVYISVVVTVVTK